MRQSAPGNDQRIDLVVGQSGTTKLIDGICGQTVLHKPDEVRIERVPLDDLAKDWPEKSEVTRTIGGTWLAGGSTALLRVPSAIVPETFNVLLNPAHPDAKRIVVARATEHVMDPRLLK